MYPAYKLSIPLFYLNLHPQLMSHTLTETNGHTPNKHLSMLVTERALGNVEHWDDLDDFGPKTVSFCKAVLTPLNVERVNKAHRTNKYCYFFSFTSNTFTSIFSLRLQFDSKTVFGNCHKKNFARHCWGETLSRASIRSNQTFRSLHELHLSRSYDFMT